MFFSIIHTPPCSKGWKNWNLKELCKSYFVLVLTSNAYKAFKASIALLASAAFYYIWPLIASLAQLVEQLIRNEQVVGSSPIGGSEDCGFRILEFGLSIADILLFSHQNDVF